jgi:ABC-type transport system substrate-binding protein
MKTGGVDIIRNVSADLIPELKASPMTYVSSTPILRVPRRARRAPAALRRKLVRQAANYAIDKQASSRS